MRRLASIRTIKMCIRDRDKEYPVELKYKDEKTDLITEELAVENKPTVIRLLKVDQETGKAMAGVQFEIWKKNVPESGTEKNDHMIPVSYTHLSRRRDGQTVNSE